MNYEEKGLLNIENKFRFLNPEEKRKLKELNKEIFGTNKNITFDSNVDLTVQFEKKGYDTQRYDIKKIINSRLYETQVFEPSKVLEKLTEIDSNNVENQDDNFESNVLVTSIIKNSENNVESLMETPEEILDKEVERDIIEQEFKRILQDNNTLDEDNGILYDDEFKDENLIHFFEEPNIENYEKNHNTNNEIKIDLNRKMNKDDQNKISINSQQEKSVNDLYNYGNDIKDYEDKKRNKFLIIVALVLIAIVVVYIYVMVFGENKDNSEERGITVENSNFEEELEMGDLTNTIEPMAYRNDYNAVIEITSSNTSCTALEITNEEFRYNKDSDATTNFDNYVFANVKNENNPYSYIVLFGKNDPTFFGSLEYLNDEDYFNTISIYYIVNDIVDRYSALSFYTTNFLDERFYEDMKSDINSDEILEFINNEVAKSIYPVKADLEFKADDKFITLITYDEDEKIYYILNGYCEA